MSEDTKTERMKNICYDQGFIILLGILELCAEPLEALDEPLARGGAGGLDEPLAAAQPGQPQLLGDLGGAEGLRQVLLVGEHQQHSVS